MRGAQHQCRSDQILRRIIPADAGSTSPPWLRTWAIWDHPRGCGEHEILPVSKGGSAGSSPRMRGTLVASIRGYPNVRIIPADAGNTSVSHRRVIVPADHPRGCGEHMAYSLALAHFYGSSPRMRGTRRSAPLLIHRQWIIPADAGNTVR